MDSLAQLRYFQGRFEEAAALFDQALVGARRAWGAAHDLTGSILGGYAKSLLELERFEEAEAYLIEAHTIITSVLGAHHKKAIKQIRSLIDLYDA